MKIPKFLIKATGNIHLSKYPMWITYKPSHHKVKGNDVDDIKRMVMFGDYLMRRFDGYVNTVCTPGFWGHAGIYAGSNRVVHILGDGPVNENILDFCRADAICILQRKDYTEEIAAEMVSKAMEAQAKGAEYDFDFSTTNSKYYCTEFLDLISDFLFHDDYTNRFGRSILTPDGIRYSKKVRVKLEVIPNLRKRKEILA